MNISMKYHKLVIISLIVAGIFATGTAYASLSPLDSSPLLPSLCKITNGTISIKCSGLEDTFTFSHGKNFIINTIPSNKTVWMDANMSASGVNLGSHGTGIYSTNLNAQTLQFLKLISANTNCSISSNSTNVILSCSGSGGGGGETLDTMQNLGGGTDIYFGNNTNTNFQFNTITATGASSISTNSNLVTIYTHTYQNNTGSNLGTHGIGPYSSMSGSVLQFLSLASANSNCVITSNSTNQILTCSSSGSGISINGLNRTSFTGIITNQTFPAPKVSINGINASKFTINNFTLNNEYGPHVSLANATSYVTFNHNGLGTITPSFGFKVNSITCSNQFISAFSNSTGLFTCTSGNAGTVLTSQNVGKATGSVGVLATPTSTTIKGRNFTGTSPITITKTNDTDVAIGCSTCLTSAVTSITGTAGNVTASSSTGAVTLNTGNNLAYLAKSQTWKGTNTFNGAVDHLTNTDKFGSSSIIVRNPATTFATTITNAAITANRTLNLPLTTQTETASVVSQVNFTSPTNPATTTSTTGVMSNLFATFTPHLTGNIIINICGNMQSGTAGDGAGFDIRIGTSQIAEGTAIGNTVIGTEKIITASTASKFQTSCDQVYKTGLGIGTKEFIQIGKYAVTGGTATFSNFDVLITEVE